MWLTGFDAPSLHTLYIDKPMKGHNLMQAIARVNRVYKDKPGGLIVDYLGIASDLKKALSFYSDAGKSVTVFGRYLRKNNLHRQSHERVEKPLPASPALPQPPAPVK
jgi:type I site-specific restriction-modification system R (restriction) subunit